MTQTNENKKYNETILSPRVDILENESKVILIADMPGVSEKGVDIDLQRNCLTIKGTRTENTEENLELTNSEFRPVYSYERQFTLGDAIDVDNISASMKDGVLRLTMPKIKEPAPRRIEVKAL